MLMAENDAAGEELSNAPVIISIGGRIWKSGDKVYLIGDDAVEKAKMVETFGVAWKTASAEGDILRKGATCKILLNWTNLSSDHIQEYGYNHGMFKSGSKD